jgi:hypothetical protein
MKTPSSVLLFALINVLPLRAPAQFEGVVESKNVTTDETGASQEFVMTMWIKNDMVKIQTSGIGSQPGSILIYRNDRHVVWILNDVDRTYSEMHQDESKEQKQPAPATPGENKPVIRKTGKTKKILGYLCEKIVVKTANDETEIWGTKALGHLASSISKVFGAASSDDEGAWSDELTKLGIFPLVASTKVEGEVVESQTVTRIEARSLPDELFELPADYKRQNVGDILK